MREPHDPSAPSIFHECPCRFRKWNYRSLNSIACHCVLIECHHIFHTLHFLSALSLYREHPESQKGMWKAGCRYATPVSFDEWVSERRVYCRHMVHITESWYSSCWTAYYYIFRDSLCRRYESIWPPLGPSELAGTSQLVFHTFSIQSFYHLLELELNINNYSESQLYIILNPDPYKSY